MLIYFQVEAALFYFTWFLSECQTIVIYFVCIAVMFIAFEVQVAYLMIHCTLHQYRPTVIKGGYLHCNITVRVTTVHYTIKQ